MSSLDIDGEDGDPDVEWLEGTGLLSRFQAAQTAISRASGVTRELLQVGGHFAEYIKSTEARAGKAMTELCSVDPRDAYEILRLQKEIAAYADVHDWLEKMMKAGDEGREEYEEIVSRAEQEQED